MHPVDEYIEYLKDKGECHGVEERKFLWLMEKLISPKPHRYKGCELVFLETVFFNQKGVPCLLVKNDKEFCITAVKATNRLRPELIY